MRINVFWSLHFTAVRSSRYSATSSNLLPILHVLLDPISVWTRVKVTSALFYITGQVKFQLHPLRFVFKDPWTALMETKPIQVYTNENRL